MATYTVSTGRKTFKDVAGADSYNIAANATRVTIAGKMSGDIINLEGLASEYTVRASGRTITLTSDSQTVVFQLASTNGSASIRFLDGSLDAKFDGKTAMLGTQKLGKKAAEVNDSALGTSDSTAIDFSGTGSGGSSGTTGSTFTLTTGVDAFQPTASAATSQTTAGNDTINGVIQGAGTTGTTVQPGDFIDGGAGTDTLSITVAGAAAGGYSLSAVQTANVEKVLLSNFDTDAGNTTVAADLMNGVTTVGLSASGADGDSVFTGLRSIIAAEVRNGAGDLTLTYDTTAVSGTADVQNLTVSNNTAGTFTADGIESVAINSEVVKSTLTAVASNALKTIAVSGNQDLTISNAVSFAATTNGTTADGTVDASKFTGKLNINVSGTTSTVAVTGGAGDDTIKMAGTLTKNDVIDGGAGNNTLTMNKATLTDQFTGVKNIQTVAINAASSVAVDASKLSAGVKVIEVDLNDATNDTTVDASTISGLSGQSVVVKHGTADLSAAGDADGVSLTITNATDTAADTITVTADAIGATANKLGLDTLGVGNYETVNVASKKSTSVTANEIQTITASVATKLALSGDADLTIGSVSGGKMTELDASALAAKLTATFGTDDKIKATAAQKDTVFHFGSTLNNSDTVVGGASAKDEVTATANGLSATTGKLNISGVETITLTTDDGAGAGYNNTLDLTNVAGATAISVTKGTQTITGLNLATKLVATGDATLKVTAANATGADDTLTVEQKLSGDVTNIIEAKGGAVENLSLILNDTDATATNTSTFTLTNFEGKKVVVSQSADSTTNSNVALGTLNKSVTTIDTSAVKGTQAASAANATVAVTFNLAGAAAANVTGSDFGDTFNIAATGNVDHSIAGGAGTDTTNLSVKAGWVVADDIATENLNITVNAGDSITMTAGTAFNAATTAITVKGGNSLSVFTTPTGANGLADTVKSFDASTFAGDIAVSVVDDKFDDTLTITGGASTKDKVTAAYATAGTYKAKTVGVETLAITASNGATTAATVVVDLSNTTGVKTLSATVGDADTMTVDKVTDQLIQVVSASATTAAATIEAKLADATGTADSVSFELKDAATNLAAGTILKTTDIETVNIKASSAESISLASVTMTSASANAKVVVTGDKALTVSALSAAVNNIDASGMSSGGSFIQTGRSGTTAATYVGSAGDDTFIMRHGNDAINGGAGTDTLSLNANLVLGGIQVDLSASGDQVTSYNGAANASVQTGFESIDLSGITGSYGADITAHKDGSTITGTRNADQITLGAGADRIAYNAAVQFATKDTVNNFTVGSDKVQIAGALLGDGNTTLTFTKAAAATAAALSEINVFTTALANDAAVVSAIQTVTSTTPSLFVIYNTAAGEAQIWYDASANVDGGETLIASLAGVTVAKVGDLVAADFVLV